MEYRIGKLNEYIRGWINYYGISQYYRPLQNLDDWLCRRIRMCYWKRWHYPRTMIRKLMELGIPKDFAVITGSYFPEIICIYKFLIISLWNVDFTCSS